jgi:hypothetical protein
MQATAASTPVIETLTRSLWNDWRRTRPIATAMASTRPSTTSVGVANTRAAT